MTTSANHNLKRLNHILSAEMLKLKPIYSVVIAGLALAFGCFAELIIHSMLGNTDRDTVISLCMGAAFALGFFMIARKEHTQKNRERLASLHEVLERAGQPLPIAVETITTNPAKPRRTTKITNAQNQCAFVPLKRWERISDRLEKEGIRLDITS